jgi:hypothetical protein
MKINDEFIEAVCCLAF